MIVINDITEEVKKCRTLLYADDTVIFTFDNDSKTIEGMLIFAASQSCLQLVI